MESALWPDGTRPWPSISICTSHTFTFRSGCKGVLRFLAIVAMAGSVNGASTTVQEHDVGAGLWPEMLCATKSTLSVCGLGVGPAADCDRSVFSPSAALHGGVIGHTHSLVGGTFRQSQVICRNKSKQQKYDDR